MLRHELFTTTTQMMYSVLILPFDDSIETDSDSRTTRPTFC